MFYVRNILIGLITLGLNLSENRNVIYTQHYDIFMRSIRVLGHLVPLCTIVTLLFSSCVVFDFLTHCAQLLLYFNMWCSVWLSYPLCTIVTLFFNMLCSVWLSPAVVLTHKLTCIGHEGTVNFCCFSSDGNLLASA